ncbi:MAG: ATP-binding cassette domain-containing protein, partial [Clostridia bacterium]|nr:ATP-binding cassette domain-containing protein [Clostridia bacterium]
MLEAVNLCKSFEGKPVITGFSQKFLPGVHYGLMGPSGCGKTTLLNLLMGLLKPDNGEIKGRPKLSAVFQEDRLLEHMTAHGNIRLVCNAPDEAIAQMLLSLGLPEESLTQPVAEYSGGMKRRVALARALLA